MDLGRFPKVNAIPHPTPLEELPHLRRALGCKPRLFVKRDDGTTLGLGGNKTRKLQFIMADALRQEADVVITTGGVQSNHCRQTLALARRLGLDCHLVLTGDEPPVRQGNCLIFTILGAHLHFVDLDADYDAAMAAVAGDLRASGRRPYIVPMGGSTPLGALGYVESLLEVADQAEALGVTFGHGFVPAGSCGTQAGLEVGVRERYPAMRIHGVAVSRPAPSLQPTLAGLVDGVYALLGMDKRVPPSAFIVHDQYYGEGYALPTEAANAAIRLVGRTEGLILDPVYTGKMAAGLFDLLGKGELDDAEAVLFFHTGGHPALFAMADCFQP